MISLKSKREIEIIREAAKILKKVFREVQAKIQPGVRTEELDRLAEEIIRASDAEPAFKGYRGFPKTACISLNEEVVHGIPGKRELKEGDLVSFDIGAKLGGYYADAARSWHVGDSVSHRAKGLIETAEQSLKTTLQNYRFGWRISDLSENIQKFIEARGYQVIRDYVGHGIGRMLHEEPQVPNYGKGGHGPKIEPGLVLAIEPMICEGHYAVEVLGNGWTVVTKDGKWAGHYEDTVVFTENGFVNLTED